MKMTVVMFTDVWTFTKISKIHDFIHLKPTVFFCWNMNIKPNVLNDCA